MAKPGDDDDDYKAFLSVLDAPQDWDSHLGGRKQFLQGSITATPPPPSGEVEMGGPVKMTSIASGSMDLRDARVSLSLDDFNDLRERIESLEEERKPRPGSGEEATGLLATIPRDPSEEGKRPHGPRTESQIEPTDDEYEMPDSMYTLLTTEDVQSIPFVTAIVTGGMSLSCLWLALWNMKDEGTPGRNFFGVPAGVTPLVRAAQYLGVMIGVINLEEIPQALTLISKWLKQDPRSTPYYSMPRVVLPALLKMLIGYTFLACLFFAVVQGSTVLGIFYDVLALQFVESFDDILHGVCKSGFFGRTLSVATSKKPTIETSTESHTSRRRISFFIRFVYILNILVIVVLLTYTTSYQRIGEYRCNLVDVSFGDAVWEEAYATIDGKLEKRLLIYSHFNGIYKEDGTTTDGRPKYTEQNKEEGIPFKKTKPAEISYCEEIESWVFRHDDIKASNHTDVKDVKNECGWLLRSPETESYDIVNLAEEVEWFVWRGLIETDYEISIECTECDLTGDGDADCNYNGNCTQKEQTSKCECERDFFGHSCQFKRPCRVIRPEKNESAQLTLLEVPEDNKLDVVESYGRPIYVMRNMSGKPYSVMRLGYPDDDDSYFNGEELVPHKHSDPDYFGNDDFFEANKETTEFQELLKEYTFKLIYTGRRWYGQIVPPTTRSFAEEEYHAFWNNTFSAVGEPDNSNLLVSAPTSEGSPVGVDFYEMRRRNVAKEGGKYDYDYSPYGVLIPLIEHEGSGFFHCNKDD